jgi:hypothetical protein
MGATVAAKERAFLFGSVCASRAAGEPIPASAPAVQQESLYRHGDGHPPCLA